MSAKSGGSPESARLPTAGATDVARAVEHGASEAGHNQRHRALSHQHPIAASADLRAGSGHILDRTIPTESARAFLRANYVQAGNRILHFYKDEFHCWQGTHYQTLDPNTLRSSVYRFLDDAQRFSPKTRESVPFAPNRRSVDDVIDALRAECNLAATLLVPAWLGKPCTNDLILPPLEVLACANGLLHLPTGELHPHTSLFFSLNALDFPYLDSAPSPKEWLNFLRSLWTDDPASIDTLQEVFGYLLWLASDLQKIFMLIGPTRSGKGTIARVLFALLGRSNVCGPTLSGLATQFGLEPLIGKRLAVISDARLSDRSDQAIVVERLLSISGEDHLTVDRKHKSAWTGQLRVRFLVLTNEMPRLRDSSGALASRFIILRLRRSFLGQEDPTLVRRLSAELPAILNWALEGWQRLIERGFFVQPESASEDLRDLERLTSPIRTFLHDRCILGSSQEVACDTLYLAWRQWCEEQGHHPSAKGVFGRDLRAAIPELADPHQHDTDEKRGQRFYRGLSLKSV